MKVILTTGRSGSRGVQRAGDEIDVELPEAAALIGRGDATWPKGATSENKKAAEKAYDDQLKGQAAEIKAQRAATLKRLSGRVEETAEAEPAAETR